MVANEEASGGAGSFGVSLKAVRVELGLSQGQVAQKVGLDRSYINRLEAGERGAPSGKAILAIAEALALDEGATDRLLVAAGQPVRALVALGLDDPTLLAIARRLTDPALSEASRHALRVAINSITAYWGSGPTRARGTAKAPRE